MQPLVSDPWFSGGTRFQVTTDPLPGETQQQHQARHDEAVEYMRGLFPPD